MTDAPYFTVIMATYGRGPHIVPSILSVLRQSFAGYELIVVGDACTDETEAVVRDFAGQGVRWINLDQRCGSQSEPNNAGIAAARGEVIAYIGHDDIWEPDHLERLARVLQGQGQPDFAVSGLILHMPPGLAGSRVMGIFTEDGDKHRHFFPPSCVSHRKAVCERIGIWRMPMEVREPVDAEFFGRAAADLRFASTGVVTVHKFSSAERYLSYVRHSSSEQAAMLADIDAPGHTNRVAALVAEAKRLGTFMPVYPRNHDHREPGQLARENAERRGLLRRKLLVLGRGVTLRQRRELCALDWHPRPVLGIRRQYISPRPKFLLPVLAQGLARLTIRVVHPDRAAFGALAMTCNDVPVTALPSRLRRSLWGWTALYQAEIGLLPDQPTVLEFLLTPAQQGKVGMAAVALGFGIGRVRLAPVGA